jgi:hypothetical protein
MGAAEQLPLPLFQGELTMQIWLLALCIALLAGCADGVDKEQFTLENKTVSDTETKLMWSETDNRDSLTWQEAVDYCESFEGGGFQDWRMPTQAELQELINSKAGDKEEGGVINISSSLVWAAEVDGSMAAFCNFKSRRCSWMEQVISISLRALPVRDTEPTENTKNTEDTVESMPASVTTPVPHPQTTQQRLQVLDILHKQQLITPEEYSKKKAAILNEL